MARTQIAKYEAENRNEAVSFSTAETVVDVTNGSELEVSTRDDKLVLLAKNSNESKVETLTVHHGNGIQGVADLKIQIQPKGRCFITLDSGRFKWMSGENKGKILFSSTGNITVAAIVLP